MIGGFCTPSEHYVQVCVRVCVVSLSWCASVQCEIGLLGHSLTAELICSLSRLSLSVFLSHPLFPISRQFNHKHKNRMSKWTWAKCVFTCSCVSFYSHCHCQMQKNSVLEISNTPPPPQTHTDTHKHTYTPYALHSRMNTYDRTLPTNIMNMFEGRDSW